LCLKLPEIQAFTQKLPNRQAVALRKCQLAGHKRAGPKTENESQCLQFAKIAIRQYKHGCKKRGKKKEKREKGKNDKTLIRNDLNYLNLIFYDFYGPEQTEDTWHSQGSYGYIHPPLYVQSFQVTTDRCQRVVVVHGIRKFIMARGQRVVVNFTQDSLDALCMALMAHAERLNSLLEPSWPNAEKVHEEMYNMVDTLMIHAVDQKWFSAFTKIGKMVEMMTSQEIRVVSWGGSFGNFCNTSN
jgi:hypothetical protein